MEKRQISSCIITGATGMLGATLTRLLLRKGVNVTAIVRPGSKKIDNLPVGEEKLNIIECGLADYGKLSLPEVSADAVFHFAWESPFGAGRNDQKLQDQNVEYALEVVRLAKECKASVFIGAGSQAQYGFFEGFLTPDTPMSPVTAYGKAKLKAEIATREACREAGIDHIWTRILSVYGPYDNDYSMIMEAVNGIRKNTRPIFTKGEQIWDYLYSEDAAKAFLALAEYGKDGQAYVLGSGKTKELREYIEILHEIVNKTAEIGLGERPYNENQVMYLAADVTKLTEDTGYVPDTPFEEGIRRTLAWAENRESEK